METAIPLGIVVNEIISNSLKYAFSNQKEGEIIVNLYRNENHEKVNGEMNEKSADLETNRSKNERHLQYTLIVADNGPGIPEEIDFENTDSMGLQLIRVLVDQIDGHLELERKGGTKFKIRFNNK